MTNEQILAIGNKIKTVRKNKGMSLSEFAIYIEVAKSTIHRYERGEIKNISLSHFLKMANKLDLTLDELACIKEFKD